MDCLFFNGFKVGYGGVPYCLGYESPGGIKWIASGSSYCSGSASISNSTGIVGGYAGFPLVCNYFSSDTPISSVLTSTGLTSFSGIYTGPRQSTASSEETGSSFRVDIPYRKVYFKFVNSAELSGSFSARRNSHGVTFYGGVSIPTSEASAAEYINASPTSLTASGKATISLPSPTGAVTYDYTGSGLLSSEFTAASALFSTAAYYGWSAVPSPTRMKLLGRTGCKYTNNSYTAFLSWTASGEV